MAEAFILRRGGLSGTTINGQEIVNAIFLEEINRGDRVVMRSSIPSLGEYRANLYIDGSTYNFGDILGYAVESGTSNETKKVAKLFRI